MTAEANDVRVECGNCRHQWLALHLPMPLLDACRRMSDLTCPQCGVPSARIFVAMKPTIVDEPVNRSLPPMTEPTAKVPVLMSPENPTGWKLEELLDRLVAEVEVKSAKIRADARAGATRESPSHKQLAAWSVYANNAHIIMLLKSCADLQRRSMNLLDSLAPNQGPLGTPRIGAGSEP